MNIHVDHHLRPVAHGSVLMDVLRELGLAERKGVAIAINDEVVSRAIWSTRTLTDGERIVIIQATQGG